MWLHAVFFLCSTICCFCYAHRTVRKMLCWVQIWRRQTEVSVMFWADFKFCEMTHILVGASVWRFTKCFCGHSKDYLESNNVKACGVYTVLIWQLGTWCEPRKDSNSYHTTTSYNTALGRKDSCCFSSLCLCHINKCATEICYVNWSSTTKLYLFS